MQCPTCGFENMPGSAGCARCGSTLSARAMRVEAHPPRRAGAGGMRRRAAGLRWRMAGANQGIVSAYSVASLWLRNRRRISGDETDAMLRRVVIPGWPQIYAGQLWQGALLLAGFACLVAACMMEWGTEFGGLWLALAILLHLLSAVDVCHQYMPSLGFQERFYRTALVILLVLAVAYVVPCLLIRQIADPIAINGNMGPFESGDIVLTNHWWPPRSGQLVYYKIPDISSLTQEFLRFGGERVRGGPCIDRILGIAGDKVDWDDGRLTINGRPSPLKPLMPIFLPHPVSLVVPRGNVCIFPSTVMGNQYVVTSVFLDDLACVPLTQVYGRVYCRVRPWSRFQMFW